MNNNEEIKELLLSKALQYNRPEFIEEDPICIPHLFHKKEDIEISGFLVSFFAWGKRKSIIRSGYKLMSLFENEPHEYIMNASEAELRQLTKFYHRTFQGEDTYNICKSLKLVYEQHGTLEYFLHDSVPDDSENIGNAIKAIRSFFMKQMGDKCRSLKHFPNLEKKSAAKRMNLFFRWMVRHDDNGVDFGIWDKKWQPKLLIPLDVHTANVARSLGIINTKMNNWHAVIELTNYLKTIDPKDPIRFDFALFGLGIYEGVK